MGNLKEEFIGSLWRISSESGVKPRKIDFNAGMASRVKNVDNDSRGFDEACRKLNP
ncbi:MAG: hypothetical protein ACJA0B_000803 [Alcanivorax borkumensis]|jgi:hypothetical protein